MRLRRGEPSDADELARIKHACYSRMTYLPPIPTLDEYRRFVSTILLPKQEVLVAEDEDGRVVGWASMTEGSLEPPLRRPRAPEPRPRERAARRGGRAHAGRLLALDVPEERGSAPLLRAARAATPSSSPTARRTWSASPTSATSGGPPSSARASARDAEAEHRAGDHEPLDLARALVDLRDLRVAVVALDRELLRVPVAAEDLDRLGGLRGAPSPTRRASPSRPPRCAAAPAPSATRRGRRAGARRRSRSPCPRASTGSPGARRSRLPNVRRSFAYARATS